MEEIEKLKQEAAEKLKEAERLAKLTELYPDLKKHVGRWNRVAYYSPSVNPVVTDYHRRYNCGCCSDSPLEIWPYLKTEFGEVYSDPPSFFVGERDTINYGDIAYPDWEDKLREKRIPEELIKRIAYHFIKDKNVEE